MFCTSVVLIRFDCNPSMATSSIVILLFTLFVKLFELELNLSRKRWNAIKFASFKEDMVRKLICNKEELWVVLKFSQMFVNVLKCFWRENVYTQ